ncbi:hypothetical protein CKY02_18350 [Photorhabdus bodei]|nr:hypothetical protein CKY02_18350 [Photorhabdus bodei]
MYLEIHWVYTLIAYPRGLFYLLFFAINNEANHPSYIACIRRVFRTVRICHSFIPVIFQVASLLAAFAHPGHIVIYAPGDSLPCRRDAS